MWKCFLKLVLAESHLNEWINGSLSWLAAQVFCTYYLLSSVYLDITKHQTHCCCCKKKPKWSVNGFSWLSNLFPLADPPACHLVGLMSEPSGLAELCSGGQVHCMCQLCLRLTDQCEKCCCLWSFVLFRFHLCIFSFKNMNNICLWWRNPWPISIIWV